MSALRPTGRSTSHSADKAALSKKSSVSLAIGFIFWFGAHMLQPERWDIFWCCEAHLTLVSTGSQSYTVSYLCMEMPKCMLVVMELFMQAFCQLLRTQPDAGK